MELRQLRYFVAIVDHGALSRAAQVLHIAQPALTQQLRQLEDELGAQLLHRSAQGVLCTDAGKIFYQHAQAILKQVIDAKSAVTQSTDRPSGTVAIGVPQSISGALALPLLLAAQQRYPEIELQLTEELTGNLIEQLKAGRINLAVLFDDGQLNMFASTPMVEEQMMFVLRTDSQLIQTGANQAGSPAGNQMSNLASHQAGNLARKPGIDPGQAVTLAQAVACTLILPGIQHGVRPGIESTARAHGLSLGHVIEINSVAILKSAILADMGATIIPVAPLLDEIERGHMLALALAPGIARTVALCASKTIPLTNAASAVARLVLEVTDELCSSGRWFGTRILARPGA
jgi:LysR family nitrogen assimilation transcriptional regulator